mmetsp:Transcript_71995/g.116733  ORF Transcript_71995/g.116733 Transcript_71995/m.116733 type:complete len:208 (+) Transcript_71995:951-1574(+)
MRAIACARKAVAEVGRGGSSGRARCGYILSSDVRPSQTACIKQLPSSGTSVKQLRHLIFVANSNSAASNGARVASAAKCLSLAVSFTSASCFFCSSRRRACRWHPEAPPLSANDVSLPRNMTTPTTQSVTSSLARKGSSCRYPNVTFSTPLAASCGAASSSACQASHSAGRRHGWILKVMSAARSRSHVLLSPLPNASNSVGALLLP